MRGSLGVLLYYRLVLAPQDDRTVGPVKRQVRPVLGRNADPSGLYCLPEHVSESNPVPAGAGAGLHKGELEPESPHVRDQLLMANRIHFHCCTIPEALGGVDELMR